MTVRIDRRRFVMALGTGWALSACETGGAPDAAGLDVPGLDAPGLDVPGLDVPGLDAPELDGGVDWSPGTLSLVIGERTSVDLSATLPASVARGGTFSVATDGAALPTGMSLDAAGILSLGTASVGITDGVVFVYEEP